MPTKKEQTIIRIILITFVSLTLFAVAGPVSALLGRENSPAAFSVGPAVPAVPGATGE